MLFFMFDSHSSCNIQQFTSLLNPWQSSRRCADHQRQGSWTIFQTLRSVSLADTWRL